MFSILTFNAALLDVRIFNRSVYCPVDHVGKRLPLLASEILQLSPDIICLQEIFHPDLQNDLFLLLKTDYPHLAGHTRPGLKLRLGNELLVLSRFPVSAGKLFRFKQAAMEEKIFTSKGFFHSIVSIPDLGEVNLVNFHTTAGGMHNHPEHDQMEKIRTAQIGQILSYVETLDKVILAGDLNAGPQTSKTNYEQVLGSGFIDSFVAAGGEGHSWDPGNPFVTNGREGHLPAQKIDHIFMDGLLAGSIKPVGASIVLDDDNRLNTGPGIPLSDHYGVMVSFEHR